MIEVLAPTAEPQEKYKLGEVASAALPLFNFIRKHLEPQLPQEGFMRVAPQGVEKPSAMMIVVGGEFTIKLHNPVDDSGVSTEITYEATLDLPDEPESVYAQEGSTEGPSPARRLEMRDLDAIRGICNQLESAPSQVLQSVNGG